jgi:phosphoribosyl 1,2-cyclic phosphodiesterase
MELKVLGSSSAGNCYIFKADSGEVLLYEAGMPLHKVKEALSFDLSNIVGLIATHVHGDHTGHIAEYLNAGITAYLSPETAKLRGPHHNIKVIQPKKTYQIGSFKIIGFSLKHDVENYGFLIYHDESGLIVAITDTQYCPFKFPGMNQVIIECNYSDEIMDRNLANGSGNMYVRNRVIKSHMELQTTIDFLLANDLSKVNNIVLIHLSAGNSNAAEFQKKIQDITGKAVHIAAPGLDIPFNKEPF